MFSGIEHGLAKLKLASLVLASLGTAVPAGAAPPSIPGADAPELAAIGPDPVGLRSVTLVHKDQPMLEASDPKTGSVRIADRNLLVDIWYPAQSAPGARRVTYRAAFAGEPPHPPVSFTVPGLAVRDAPARGARHPLVIVSHGYGNTPAAMTWLTENLASKGYVVAAIHHDDPNLYTALTAARAAPNFNRLQDILFVAAELKTLLTTQINPDRIALIGYSQGGYGVLTVGGASLDPASPSIKQVAGGWLKPYARGGPRAADLHLSGLKAIVALAPAGGFGVSYWGKAGPAGITTPLLLIQGDADPVVDPKLGAYGVFANAVNADRYLLTYRLAGHAIGHNPLPAEMQKSLWDMDWFADPIWRAERINAINLHFITAFLGVHLRDSADRAAYLNVAVENSDDGVWDAPAGTPWGAYSPGGTGVTLWKGFQRRHARGLQLQRSAATPGTK